MNSISDHLTVTTPLPRYLPYARFLLDTDLSHTAKLLYTLLLDRATLSQKNNWVDERGFVYVIFPISSLSEALRCSTMSIKRALRSLEDADLIDRLAIPSLVRAGGELVGPCPGCGGKDRFGINVRKGVFLCRRCDAKGDQIALVQLVLGLDFPAALEWLVGPRQELTAAQRAEQQRRADHHRRQREAEAERRRQDAIALARQIWERAQSRRTPRG